MSLRLDGLNPLSYMGVTPYSPPQFEVHSRAPTTNDNSNFNLGTIWLDRVSLNVYMLVSLAEGVADWVLFTNGTGSVTALTADNGGVALPNSIGQIGIQGGLNIHTTASGSNVQVILDDAITVSGNIITTGGEIFTINGSFEVGNTENNGQPALVQFLKSRSGGTITSGDQLGFIDFLGFDGTGYSHGAEIVCTSLGTIGTNRIAANLTFSTHPDSVAASPTVRMTIGEAGNITIATPDSGEGLTVASTVIGTTLRASGDAGGTALQNSLSNVSDLTANAGGTFTIKSKSANNADSAGFIKIYIGVTAYYIPVFTSPSP